MAVIDQVRKLQSIEGKMFKNTIETFVQSVKKKSPLDIFRFQMACDIYADYRDLFMQDPIEARLDSSFSGINPGLQNVSRVIYEYVVKGLSYETLDKMLFMYEPVREFVLFHEKSKGATPEQLQSLRQYMDGAQKKAEKKVKNRNGLLSKIFKKDEKTEILYDMLEDHAERKKTYPDRVRNTKRGYIELEDVEEEDANALYDVDKIQKMEREIREEEAKITRAVGNLYGNSKPFEGYVPPTHLTAQEQSPRKEKDPGVKKSGDPVKDMKKSMKSLEKAVDKATDKLMKNVDDIRAKTERGDIRRARDITQEAIDDYDKTSDFMKDLFGNVSASLESMNEDFRRSQDIVDGLFGDMPSSSREYINDLDRDILEVMEEYNNSIQQNDKEMMNFLTKELGPNFDNIPDKNVPWSANDDLIADTLMQAEIRYAGIVRDAQIMNDAKFLEQARNELKKIRLAIKKMALREVMTSGGPKPDDTPGM